MVNCFVVQKGMHDAKARVRDGVSLTESIHCIRGVKQGDVRSPILFSLFMNKLMLDMWQTWRNTYINLSEIFILALLFADDIILLSDTAIGLQNQLNILYRSSEKLKVNFDLSNIIVFRKVGCLAAHGFVERIEVVNAYKYLGLYFTVKLRFNTACDDLAARGKRAVLLGSWVF